MSPDTLEQTIKVNKLECDFLMDAIAKTLAYYGLNGKWGENVYHGLYSKVREARYNTLDGSVKDEMDKEKTE